MPECDATETKRSRVDPEENVKCKAKSTTLASGSALLSGSRAVLGTIATVPPAPKVSVILLPLENVSFRVTLSNSPWVNTLSSDCSKPPRFSAVWRSEEHTSDLQSLLRNSYAVFCLIQKTNTRITDSSLSGH